MPHIDEDDAPANQPIVPRGQTIGHDRCPEGHELPERPTVTEASPLQNYRFVGSDPRPDPIEKPTPLPTDPQRDQWTDRPAEEPDPDGASEDAWEDEGGLPHPDDQNRLP